MKQKKTTVEILEDSLKREVSKKFSKGYYIPCPFCGEMMAKEELDAREQALREITEENCKGLNPFNK